MIAFSKAAVRKVRVWLVIRRTGVGWARVVRTNRKRRGVVAGPDDGRWTMERFDGAVDGRGLGQDRTGVWHS